MIIKKILVSSALVLILVFLIIGNYRLNKQRQDVESTLDKITEKVNEMQEQKEFLQTKISQSQTIEYSEKIAREEYNLKKQGETVVAFPVLEDEAAEPVSVKAMAGEESFWQKFLKKFGFTRD